ncbi:HET-domain-containing protein [Apiospora arundinis]
MAKALKKLDILDINWRNGPGAHRLFLDKAKSLVSTEEDGAFDLEEANEVIEELEALLYFGTQFGPYAPEGMADFYQLTPTMASMITQLKDRVFQHRALPQLCELAKGGPKVCRYCNWAIERIGQGRDSVLSDPRISTQPRGCFAYTHLCAVDSSQTLPLLEQRSQEGCVLCGYLREHFLISLQVPDAVDDDTPDDIYGPFYVWLLFDWDDKPRRDRQRGNTLQFFTLQVMREGRNSRTSRQVRFSVGSNDSRLSNSLGLLSPPRPAPLDPGNLKLIQDCLSAGDHKNTNARFTPKRLLDLGTTDAFLPRVVDMAPSYVSTDDQPVEYVALSYCWGPHTDASRQLHLTAESKQSIYQGISTSDLTPVVRDAVTTCRALGFRFLWVDALCILQRDTEDWEEHSYDMEKVFAGSTLTICAMATSSCLDSFLQRTHDRLDLPLGSDSGLSPTASITLFPCWSDQKLPFYGGYRQRNTEPPLQTDLRISSWSRRGWVFRLSGIARVFKDVYQDDYVAGLWAKDIACGLLWDTKDNREAFKDFYSSLSSNEQQVGPSWSWTGRRQSFLRFHLTLSTNWRCRVRSHLRSEVLQVRAENHVNGKNPFGRIHSAALHISGLLLGIPGKWEPEELSSFWYTTSEGQVVCVDPDWNMASVEGDDRRKFRLLLLSSCCSEPPTWEIGEDRFGPRESVTYRRDYRHTFYEDRNREDNGPARCTLCGPEHERDAWGLLIYPAAQAGTYYRVGTFLCRAQLGGRSIFDHGYTDSIILI